jgi:hypothetical protein
MAHVHKVARYVQLLRANPARKAPQLHVVEATTVDDVRLWKERIRAFDEALIQLKIRTPAEITEENTPREPENEGIPRGQILRLCRLFRQKPSLKFFLLRSFPR